MPAGAVIAGIFVGVAASEAQARAAREAAEYQSKMLNQVTGQQLAFTASSRLRCAYCSRPFPPGIVDNCLGCGAPR